MTLARGLPKRSGGGDRTIGLARETSDFHRRVLPHADAAYSLARWLVREPAMAEDVAQEAMLRAGRAHGQLRGEPKPWLLQIVRHVAYAMMAARRKTGETGWRRVRTERAWIARWRRSRLNCGSAWCCGSWKS